MDALTRIGNMISGRTPVDFFDITFIEGSDGFSALKALVESNDFRFSLPSSEAATRLNLLFAVEQKDWKTVNTARKVRCFLSDIMPRNSAAFTRFMEHVAPYIQKLAIGDQKYEKK